MPTWRPAPPADRASQLGRRASTRRSPRWSSSTAPAASRDWKPIKAAFLISAEGHILTVWSYVLDTDYLSVMLADGRKFEAKLVGADPRLEIAVLKIDAQRLDHFDLAHGAVGDAGTRVWALSNLFGVATGDEPDSVQHGVVAAKTQLDARRGVYETPYHGPVYVVDCVTNNPGAAGGALVNLRGELLGMLGKELRNSQNNVWLNYAIPLDQFAAARRRNHRRQDPRRARKAHAATARRRDRPGPARHRDGARRAGTDAALYRTGPAPVRRRRPPGCRPTTWWCSSASIWCSRCRPWPKS